MTRQPDHRRTPGHDIPLGRAGTVSEASGAAYLLCTPEADYITGQILVCARGHAF